MAKKISYNRILTNRILDTDKRKLKHLKRFNGNKNFYLLEFVEKNRKKIFKKINM